jgi:hypothetical protein
MPKVGRSIPLPVDSSPINPIDRIAFAATVSTPMFGLDAQPVDTELESIDALLEYQTRRRLEAAGLTLQKAPRHLGGVGFQIMAGRQVLAGRGRGEYELSLADVIHFAKRAGILL